MRIRSALPVSERFLDVGVVILIFGAGVLESVFGPEDLFPGSRLLHVAFMAAVSMPLLWRRVHPGITVLVVAVASSAYSLTVFDLGGEPPIEPFLALLVALYTSALYARGRRDVVLQIVASSVLLAESGLAVIKGRGVGHAVPPLAFYAGALLLGRFMRSRKTMITYLEEHTISLEKNRERDLQYAVEHERGRIARELHDVIAHCLSVIVVQASAERRLLTDADDRTRSTLASIEETGREALVELRSLLGILRKKDDDTRLSPQPGLDGVDDLVAQIRGTGLEVDLDVQGDRPEVPQGVDLSAYRIVQEALTNAVKHAQASKVSISVVYSPREVMVEVTDDGRGPVEGPTAGFGLVGIKERVALYGGQLRTGRGPGGGFQVRCVLPFQSQ